MSTDYEIEQEAKALIETLASFVNVMGGDGRRDGLANALANTHPTLIGQIAKAVGIGVMRRSVRDEEWKPFDRYDRSCTEGRYLDPDGNPIHHADHDGRLDCTTVIGAELMARQSLI